MIIHLSYIHSLLQGFVVGNLLNNNISKDKIMVLTPYRAQISCCKEFSKLEQPIEIMTIHGSQGYSIAL